MFIQRIVGEILYVYDPIWDHTGFHLYWQGTYRHLKPDTTPSRFMIDEIAGEARKTLKTYLQWILNSLISVVALVLWVIFQYGMSRIIVGLELSGLDAYVFLVLQVFSAISTLMPIAFYIYEDTRRMWQRSIKREPASSEGGNGG